MHHFKRLFLVAVGMFLLAVALSTSSEGFSHRRRASRSGHDDLFRKLGISEFTNPTNAPDFTLQDLQGNSISLRDFRGKVVFLNFWATWCPPCRYEMPFIDRLYGRLKGRGLVVLAVDMKESRRQVAEFKRDFRLSFSVLLDTKGTVSSFYGVRGLPSTYLIGAGGRIIGKKVGPRDWATRNVVELFKQLLENNEAPGSYAGPPIVSEPSTPFPSVLFVKSSEGTIYRLQDKHSGVIAKLGRGEKLIPLAKASGGEGWYLVKTQKGGVGWIRVIDVKEDSKIGRQ